MASLPARDDESSVSASVMKTAAAVAKTMRAEGSRAFSMTLRSASKKVEDTASDNARRINEATDQYIERTTTLSGNFLQAADAGKKKLTDTVTELQTQCKQVIGELNYSVSAAALEVNKYTEKVRHFTEETRGELVRMSQSTTKVCRDVENSREGLKTLNTTLERIGDLQSTNAVAFWLAWVLLCIGIVGMVMDGNVSSIPKLFLIVGALLSAAALGAKSVKQRS